MVWNKCREDLSVGEDRGLQVRRVALASLANGMAEAVHTCGSLLLTARISRTVWTE